MSGLKILSENYVQGATVSLTTGTANAQFPLSNLQNASPATKFRSVGNTAVIELDLVQTRAISCIGIFADPSSEFGVTAASLKTSVNTDFSGSTPINLDVYGEQGMAYAIFPEISHRYAEVTLTGSGTYVEVGALVIGEMDEFENQNLSIDTFEYGYEDLSVTTPNRYGQLFIDELPLIKTLTGAIQFANLAEQEQLDEIIAFVGRRKPVFAVVDSEGTGMNDGESKLSIYGYITNSPKWTASGGLHYTTSLSFRQAV